MKSEKARELVKTMEVDYNAHNKMINSTVAHQAVQLAEEELTQKAIKAACNHCIQSGGGCGHIDREDDAMMYCSELEDFIKELNA